MQTFALDTVLRDLILQKKLLSEDILREIEVQAERAHRGADKMLIDEGHLSEEQMAMIQAEAHGWEFVDLNRVSFGSLFASLIPGSVALAQDVIVFRQDKEGIFHIATTHPENAPFLHLLGKRFHGRMKTYLTTTSAINDALIRYDKDFSEECREILATHEQAVQERNAEDDSIVVLLNALLRRAVRHKASDIHLQPERHETVVRERRDGILHDILMFPNDVLALMTLRVKILAHLATDEHSIPQDGKFTYEPDGGQKVDVRVSTVPTIHGEKIVLRLLAEQKRALTLPALGLQLKDQVVIEEQEKNAWGMILATGPTGSGKTTTLYALLRRVNSRKVNVATIEDPVEYELPGVSQIQVMSKFDLTFARGLRSIVRQDPDIILVGEIRDAETAKITVNAAMTGHLVFSTMHTNDAATTIPRLLDLGIEPFLIASTLKVAIGQRLVRKICEWCKQTTAVDIHELEGRYPEDIVAILHRKHSAEKIAIQLSRGTGCRMCTGTGFRGRTGIFEVLSMTDTTRALILKRADADTIAAAAREESQDSLNVMTTMIEDGIEKVLQGTTTIEEILRVTRA